MSSPWWSTVVQNALVVFALDQGRRRGNLGSDWGSLWSAKGAPAAFSAASSSATGAKTSANHRHLNAPSARHVGTGMADALRDRTGRRCSATASAAVASSWMKP